MCGREAVKTGRETGAFVDIFCCWDCVLCFDGTSCSLLGVFERTSVVDRIERSLS